MSVSRHLVRKMRKRKRGRRKKDLANTETAVKKGKKKFNSHICRLEPQLQCAASVSRAALGTHMRRPGANTTHH